MTEGLLSTVAGGHRTSDRDLDWAYHAAERHRAGSLAFDMSDDGAGFDAHTGHPGAGFTNMLDRLGALGGTLRVESAPGKGTVVSGALPVSRIAS